MSSGRPDNSTWKVRLPVWTAFGLVAFGLILFATLVASPNERQSLWMTMAFGSASGLLGLSLGGVISGSLGRGTFVTRLSLIACVFASCLPIYWHLAAWDAAFGQLGWWVTLWSNNPLHLALPRWVAAVWVQGASAAPFAAIMIFLFQRENGRVSDEQGLLDASQWQVFWRISARRQFPIWGLIASWIFITSSREIAVTDIYQIGTVAEQVYLGFALGQSDQFLLIWPEGYSVVSIRLYVATVIWVGALALVLVDAVKRCLWNGEVLPARNHVFGKYSLRVPVGLILNLLLLVVPLANLILRVGLRLEATPAGPTPRWTLSALMESFSRARLESYSEFLWSLSISITTTCLLLAGSVLAVGFTIRRRNLEWAFFGSILLTIALPGPVIGALIARCWSLWEQPWAWWLADRTIFLQVCASMVYCWPLAALAVWLTVQATPLELRESAAIQGLTGWQQYISVQVWGRKNALMGIWLLVLMLSFGELSAQQMVAAAGIDTIPRQLLGWMHSGVDELAAATSLFVAFFMALLTAILVWLWGLSANVPPR